MKISDQLKNMNMTEKVILILCVVAFFSLIYRITFDIAHNQTISYYLNTTGR